MQLSVIEVFLLFFGGFAAGIINTFAGFGSIITLSLLMDVVGIPATVANGTNRVNILAMGAVAGWTFHKNGKIHWGRSRSFIFFTLVGAIGGVAVATQISNEDFRAIFRYLILGLFLLILINPKKWLHEENTIRDLPLIVTIPISLVIGFYGGFVQMGVGILILAFLVLISRYDLIQANATKITVVAVYTLFVLAIFWSQGLVDWLAAWPLVIGQALGGYVTAKYSSTQPNAGKWAYKVLIIVVLVVVLKQFGVFEYLFSF